MNTIAFNIFLLSFVILCSGTLHPIVNNTRTEVCSNEDKKTCKIICSWDNAEVAEGETLNEPYRCRLLECSNDGKFTLVVTACAVDRKYTDQSFFLMGTKLIN